MSIRVIAQTFLILVCFFMIIAQGLFVYDYAVDMFGRDFATTINREYCR